MRMFSNRIASTRCSIIIHHRAETNEKRTLAFTACLVAHCGFWACDSPVLLTHFALTISARCALSCRRTQVLRARAGGHYPRRRFGRLHKYWHLQICFMKTRNALEVAPMEGVMDRPMRRALSRSIGGADSVRREFVRLPKPTGSTKSNESMLSGALSHVHPFELSDCGMPVALPAQLMSGSPLQLRQASSMLVHKGVSHVNLNAGCPSCKVYTWGTTLVLRKLFHDDCLMSILCDHNRIILP